jgi:light-regulated signal transduction histidine kinase (bacteriophytochrome)
MVPVILLSARAGEESRVEGLAAGADDYLLKPFGARELLARVETIIELAGLRRELMSKEEERRAEAHIAHVLRESELRLRQTNRELLEANRELEEFAYVASHDLQEPLRTINAHAQLLLKRFADGEQELARESAHYVRTGVRRMEMLIQDLLDYSRTIHEEESSGEPVELSVALNMALGALRKTIEETGAEVVTGELPRVQGSEPQFRQVFQNLLSNALKYAKAGEPPRIHISADRLGEEWVISVRDNGIGFQQKHAERIFGLFKRLHRDEYPGTGLGLAICKRILERFGGRMWAESEPGKGSTFFFSLVEAVR